jgi:hypothetical protein
MFSTYRALIKLVSAYFFASSCTTRIHEEHLRYLDSRYTASWCGPYAQSVFLAATIPVFAIKFACVAFLFKEYSLKRTAIRPEARSSAANNTSDLESGSGATVEEERLEADDSMLRDTKRTDPLPANTTVVGEKPSF